MKKELRTADFNQLVRQPHFFNLTWGASTTSFFNKDAKMYQFKGKRQIARLG
jgi:hypothetical protein